MSERILVTDEQAMLGYGRDLSVQINPGTVLYLYGDLGCGKTTLARGIITGLGYSGLVTSPTYPLVESYTKLIPPLYHFDLYRLKSVAELEMLGARDIFDGYNACLVEWPQRGNGFLPQPTISILLELASQGRVLTRYDKAISKLQYEN